MYVRTGRPAFALICFIFIVLFNLHWQKILSSFLWGHRRQWLKVNWIEWIGIGPLLKTWNLQVLENPLHQWVYWSCIPVSTKVNGFIGLAVRVFANGLGDLGSIPGRVIPKTQKMVLDASLLNTQHYKVRIKGKVEQSRERSSALPYALV